MLKLKMINLKNHQELEIGCEYDSRLLQLQAVKIIRLAHQTNVSSQKIQFNPSKNTLKIIPNPNFAEELVNEVKNGRE